MAQVLSASFKWRDRDGSRSEFRIDEPVEWDAAFALAHKMGWPGHRGRVIDYLKDDLRKLWRRFVSLQRALIFRCILRPIISRDYRLREAGRRPDRWHWADRIAFQWGYSLTP